MRISNKLWAAGLGGMCMLPLAADDITFAGGNAQLAGDVVSISDTGVVELVSELSKEPLLLKGDAVEKVLFSRKVAAPDHPGAMLELTNGDLLPVVIESLDGNNLTVLSPDAGRLEIPRESLSSIQMGVEHRKIVYSGPRSLQEWDSGDGDLKNWEFRDRSLIADGSATASKKFALPERFVLRFTLKWQLKQTPSFQVYFADPLLAKGEPSDRYYVQFGGAGLEIKREASQGKRWTTVVLLNRTPREFANRTLEVEIRVDRKASRLVLFLNGEAEGEFVDHTPSVPTGSGISLVSNAQSGTVQEISDIEIMELDDFRTRHRSEKRGDATSDSLISREDDRWGGKLVEIRKMDDGSSLFRFKSDFQDDPLEIPDNEVSTVFFSSKDAEVAEGDEAPEDPDAKPHPFMLHLNSEGSLNVASCRFTEDTVTATHPILGELEFRREGILAMERADLKPGKPPEP